MRTARHIYLAIKGDQSCVSQVREWYRELALDCVDPEKALETTSFTLNGQSGAGELRGTKEDLLAIIGQVIWQLDNTAKLGTRTTRVRF